MDKLYTVKETMAVLRVSRATLYTLIEKGDIKALKLGGRTLFAESELDRFIEELKRKAE